MEIRTCEEYVLNELTKTQEKLTEVEEELLMVKSKYESLLKVAPMEITPGFNKNYYVRIRTYKTVKGKKIYSNWSSAKSVKTKK